MVLLRSIANAFGRAKDRALGASGTEDDVKNVLSYKLKDAFGLALGEIHGHYAFPDFMTRNMAFFKAEGVDTLYVETLDAGHQHLLDSWQYGGDPNPLIDFMDAHTKAYSEDMWRRYFVMFHAAIENKIRLVAIDGRVKDVYPGLELLGRNILWENKIVGDIKTRVEGSSNGVGKFLVYCGQAHVDKNEGGTTSISDMLKIPGVLMEPGAYGVTSLRKDDSLIRVFIPAAADQTKVYGLPMAPSRRIRPSGPK